MATMIASFICIAVALFLLWYPQWEDDRRRMRNYEREAESKRLDFIIKHGFDPQGVTLEDMHEWMHWQQCGRGLPY